MYNFSLLNFKYAILPKKKSFFTISRGPMVRKKKSREQFMHKQLFLFVSKTFKQSEVSSRYRNFDDNILSNLVNPKSLSNFFIFFNFNANFFLL